LKTLFFHIIIFSILGTSFCWSQESFEGIVTYKIELVLKKENSPNNEYIAQKFGDSLKILFNKKGDFYRKYIGAGSKGFDFQIYKAATNKYYCKWKNLDTLYYYNAKENILKLTSKEQGTSGVFFNKPSKYVTIEGYIPETGENVREKLYYTGFPYLNPAPYKNLKDFFICDLFNISKSPFVKIELEFDDHIIIYTAVKIEQKFLGPKIFKIPQNIPQKKS